MAIGFYHLKMKVGAVFNGAATALFTYWAYQTAANHNPVKFVICSAVAGYCIHKLIDCVKYIK